VEVAEYRRTPTRQPSFVFDANSPTTVRFKRFRNANVQALIDEVIVYVGNPRRVFQIAVFRWPLALESKNLQKVSIRKSLVPLRRITRKPRRNIFGILARAPNLRQDFFGDPMLEPLRFGFSAAEN
jgi:hypothetical protein